jgi:hypothetical protein
MTHAEANTLLLQALHTRRSQGGYSLRQVSAATGISFGTLGRFVRQDGQLSHHSCMLLHRWLCPTAPAWTCACPRCIPGGLLTLTDLAQALHEVQTALADLKDRLAALEAQ